MSVNKPKRHMQTPSQEELSVELPHRDAEEQPLPSFASLSLEVDDDGDALSDWGQSPTPYTYAPSNEICAEYLPSACPSWGRYDANNIVCGLCPYNVECMIAEDERNKPSRER